MKLKKIVNIVKENTLAHRNGDSKPKKQKTQEIKKARKQSRVVKPASGSILTILSIHLFLVGSIHRSIKSKHVPAPCVNRKGVAAYCMPFRKPFPFILCRYQSQIAGIPRCKASNHVMALPLIRQDVKAVAGL